MLIRCTNWIVAKNLDFGRKIHSVAVPEVKGRKGFKIRERVIGNIISTWGLWQALR